MIYTGMERLNQGVQLLGQTELVKNIESSVTSAGNWFEKKQIVYLAEAYGLDGAVAGLALGVLASYYFINRLDWTTPGNRFNSYIMSGFIITGCVGAGVVVGGVAGGIFGITKGLLKN